jgi:hypothetical protein
MTTTLSERPVSVSRFAGLRVNSFAAIMALLVQLCLGMWVNLYGHLPAADDGANVGTGFTRAISGGPVGLSIHAVVGALLVISAITATVRAVLVRHPVLIAATAAGLLAIVDAAVSGASFVGNGSNGASMNMAVATAVAIGAYAFVLLASARYASSRQSRLPDPSYPGPAAE